MFSMNSVIDFSQLIISLWICSDPKAAMWFEIIFYAETIVFGISFKKIKECMPHCIDFEFVQKWLDIETYKPAKFKCRKLGAKAS